VAAGNNRISLRTCASNGVIITDTLVDFSGEHTIRARIEETQSSLEIDGQGAGPQSHAGVINVGTIRTRIGSSTNDTASNFWQGDIKDVICTGLLTSQQAASMYDYLGS
jgi:hypothetical protein